MPVYDPNHVEYSISSGHIHIVLDDGSQLPAYWSHPKLGNRFPGIALIHDWWGVNSAVRRLAHLLAQMGYYVIVPDLFNGQVATSPQQAMALVEALGDKAYPRIHAALTTLESHHQGNKDVAAVGIGMGGSLAFEAAIVRDDLEAAVAFAGFPQRYFGRFKDAHAPILAFYGKDEPHIKAPTIEKLSQELAQSSVEHEVVILPSLAHDFFIDGLSVEQQIQGRIAISKMLAFLEKFLKGPVGARKAKR